MLYGRDRGRFSQRQIEALTHPIRLRILELFTNDTDRSLAAHVLAAELTTLGAEFKDVTVSQIGYHVARLQDADLLPRAHES